MEKKLLSAFASLLHAPRYTYTSFHPSPVLLCVHGNRCGRVRRKIRSLYCQPTNERTQFARPFVSSHFFLSASFISDAAMQYIPSFSFQPDSAAYRMKYLSSAAWRKRTMEQRKKNPVSFSGRRKEIDDVPRSDSVMLQCIAGKVACWPGRKTICAIRFAVSKYISSFSTMRFAICQNAIAMPELYTSDASSNG